MAQRSRPLTRFRTEAMPTLMNATEHERDTMTTHSESAKIWLRTESDGAEVRTNWKFPVNLANFVFVHHDFLLVKEQSIYMNPPWHKILVITLEQLPREKEDIRYVLCWLEFYACDGEPPQIKPTASRSYLHRYMLAARQIGVPAMVNHINARIEELTKMRQNRPLRGPANQAADQEGQDSSDGGQVVQEGQRDEPLPRSSPKSERGDSVKDTLQVAALSIEREPSPEQQLQQDHRHSIQAIISQETEGSAAQLRDSMEQPQVQDQSNSPDPSESRSEPLVANRSSQINGEQSHPEADGESVTDDPVDNGDTAVAAAPSPDTHLRSGESVRSVLRQPLLPTSDILRSPHTPANSANSRARSNPVEQFSLGLNGNNHPVRLNGFSHEDTAVNGQSDAHTTEH